MLGIYVIENQESDKHYIGSTVNLKRRTQDHRSALYRGSHPNPHLQSSWNKYGESAFTFGILEYLDNPEELHLAEQFWMDIYRLEGKELYNIGLVARCPMIGYKHSEETRQKLRKARKGGKPRLGHRTTSEHRRKISNSLKGHVISEETRQKIGAASRRYWSKRKGGSKC